MESRAEKLEQGTVIFQVGAQPPPPNVTLQTYQHPPLLKMLSFSEVKQEGEKRRIFGKRQVSTDPWSSRHYLNPDFFCHHILLKVTNTLKIWKHIRPTQSMVLNDPVFVISIILPRVKEKRKNWGKQDIIDCTFLQCSSQEKVNSRIWS